MHALHETLNAFLCYLDTLDIEFKIIALSETAINSTHTKITISQIIIVKWILDQRRRAVE